jgi:hypothetical protein
MNKALAFTLAAAFALGGAVAAATLLARGPVDGVAASGPVRAVWNEVQWPFPVDQWGGGKAFRCKRADCGGEVTLYRRAKLGSSNCTNGIADDAELDRMSDFDLIGGGAAPLGEGRSITVATMKGRSRAYALTGRNSPGKGALSLALNERCDMIVATAVLPHDRPAIMEPAALEFLNSPRVLRWAEVSLGL